jgi:uncharacterized membrane protein YqjE
MGGLMESVRGAFDSFVKALETRVDLFALELQEEKIRFAQIILWTCAAVFLTALSLIMVTLSVVLLIKPELREEAIITFTILYVIASGVSGYKLYQILYKSDKPFSSTIDQLKRDQSDFTSKL